MTFALESIREFADAGCLTYAIHTNHQEDCRSAILIEAQRSFVIAALQDLANVVGNRIAKLIFRFDLALPGEILDGPHQPRRCTDTEITCDQQLLELFEGALVHTTDEDGYISQRNVFDLLPKRTFFFITESQL